MNVWLLQTLKVSLPSDIFDSSCVSVFVSVTAHDQIQIEDFSSFSVSDSRINLQNQTVNPDVAPPIWLIVSFFSPTNQKKKNWSSRVNILFRTTE